MAPTFSEISEGRIPPRPSRFHKTARAFSASASWRLSMVDSWVCFKASTRLNNLNSLGWGGDPRKYQRDVLHAETTPIRVPFGFWIPGQFPGELCLYPRGLFFAPRLETPSRLYIYTVVMLMIYIPFSLCAETTIF
jgi:hypothetical protein